jgi:hypothetical protein
MIRHQLIFSERNSTEPNALLNNSKLGIFLVCFVAFRNLTKIQ